MLHKLYSPDYHALSKEDKAWLGSRSKEPAYQQLEETAAADSVPRLKFLLSAHSFKRDHRQTALFSAVRQGADAATGFLLALPDTSLPRDDKYLTTLVRIAAAAPDRLLEQPDRINAWKRLYDYNMEREEEIAPLRRRMTNAGSLPLPAFGAATVEGGSERAMFEFFSRAAMLPPEKLEGVFATALSSAIRHDGKGRTERTDTVLRWKDHFPAAQDAVNEALVAVSGAGDLAKARVLRKTGKADPNHDGAAALVGAAMGDHDAVRDFLFAEGADVRLHENVKGPKMLVTGLAAMAEAAEAAKLDRAETLQVTRLQIAAVDKEGKTLTLSFNLKTWKSSSVNPKGKMDFSRTLSSLQDRAKVEQAGNSILRIARKARLPGI